MKSRLAVLLLILGFAGQRVGHAEEPQRTYTVEYTVMLTDVVGDVCDLSTARIYDGASIRIIGYPDDGHPSDEHVIARGRGTVLTEVDPDLNLATGASFHPGVNRCPNLEQYRTEVTTASHHRENTVVFVHQGGPLTAEMADRSASFERQARDTGQMLRHTLDAAARLNHELDQLEARLDAITARLERMQHTMRTMADARRWLLGR